MIFNTALRYFIVLLVYLNYSKMKPRSFLYIGYKEVLKRQHLLKVSTESNLSSSKKNQLCKGNVHHLSRRSGLVETFFALLYTSLFKIS